jgi:GNAT superfamily N-acetyltransferase
MGHDVFISYSSGDKAIADQLLSGLEAQNVTCWMAPRDVVPGIPYAEAIIEALSQSRTLVLVFSSRSNRSRHVAREVTVAADKETHIIPFRIENVEPSGTFQYLISNLHIIDAWTLPLEPHLRKVVRAVKDRLPQAMPSPGSGVANAKQIPLVSSGPRGQAPKAAPTRERAPEQKQEHNHEIKIAKRGQLDQESFRRIREWLTQRDHTGPIQPYTDLSEAFGSVNGTKNVILITLGFEKAEIERVRRGDQRDLEVIAVLPELHEPEAVPSASFLEPSNLFVGQDPVPALRKSILRLGTRRYASIRPLEGEEEFRAYFSLRYSVWKELGYLPEEKDSVNTQWEVDYTDRTAIPLGIFSRSDNSLIGCARLVRGMGEEDTKAVSLIDRIIDEKKDAILQGSFQYPSELVHPFDVLGAFEGFRRYYRSLVVNNVAKAEVSRVIVKPEYQNHGLGEVLVDSLVSFAEQRRLQILFLACQEKHGPFYERCGFRAISGMRSDSFVNIKKPSIAMERTIGGPI